MTLGPLMPITDCYFEGFLGFPQSYRFQPDPTYDQLMTLYSERFLPLPKFRRPSLKTRALKLKV